MSRVEVVVSTKLAPPRLHGRLLARPALDARLREALNHRLTLVQAGTGYGKSTALAALQNTALHDAPLFWYSLDDADVDPQRFLSHLIAAFHLRLPALSDAPAALLNELAGEGAWPQVIDALVNALNDALAEPALLVVDDYQFVADAIEVRGLIERFLTYLPPQLHIIIAGRHPVQLPSLTKWRVKGEVLEVQRAELAFAPAEIETLFRETYGFSLSPDEVNALAHQTEGWPIALQLVWQGLRALQTRRVADVLGRGASSLGALFDYLAGDVLDRLPPGLAEFLTHTSILRELTPAACDAIRQTADSADQLQRLIELDLFIVTLDDGAYRYHHLFHDFLREVAAADPIGLAERHRRAAAHFQNQRHFDEAIYHWLNAASFEAAAGAIELAGEAALRAGRLDTVATWIDALPPATLAAHPLLQAYLADVYRLRSRFDDALAWYAQAENTWRARNDAAGVSRALRGQALIYLDTVRPAQAEHLLQEALRLTDGMTDRSARARLLELLAENKLNMGKPDEAQMLRAEAQALRDEGPTEDTLTVRVKLRTGQLAEARRVLESWLPVERDEDAHAHSPRAHRETALLLSFILSLMGEAERAFALAKEGVELGERVNSPFVTAVGYLRWGHAWQILPDSRRDEAIRCYQHAVTLGDQLAVRRTRVEAMWGLTRAHLFFDERDMAEAERTAQEGIETGRWAGDAWIVALVEVTLGAGYVLAERPEAAIEVLSRALTSFRDCGDSFGRAVTRLWQSAAYFDLKQWESFGASLEAALTLCETHGYDFLFTRSTLLGPPDPRRLVPLLIEARRRRLRAAYVTRLLNAIGLPEVQVHPGYQLRVQVLGAFRVWRGRAEVTPRDWQRDKARQLFQLLLIHRGRWLQRDEIADRLWPNLSPEAAARDFKVALNALNKAIEPNRASDDHFAYIVREGTAYRLRPEADVWIDAVDFEREAEAGLRVNDDRSAEAIDHLRAALRLYGGDYLPEALYEDWASEERERLLSLYLRAADRLAGGLIERGDFDEGLSVCGAILARDACWERAYRLMMTAYARQGNRPQALRVYQRCVDALAAELGVGPSAATLALAAELNG